MDDQSMVIAAIVGIIILIIILCVNDLFVLSSVGSSIQSNDDS